MSNKLTLVGPCIEGNFINKLRLEDNEGNCVTIVNCAKDLVPAARLFGARIMLNDSQENVTSAFNYLTSKIGTQIAKPKEIILWNDVESCFCTKPVEMQVKDFVPVDSNKPRAGKDYGLDSMPFAASYDPNKVTLMGPDDQGHFVLSDSNDNCITIAKCLSDYINALLLFIPDFDTHSINSKDAKSILTELSGTQIDKPESVRLWSNRVDNYVTISTEVKEPTEVLSFRFEASYMQADSRYRNGLWKVEDSEKGFRIIATGSKSKMQKLANLLNSKEVYFEL